MFESSERLVGTPFVARPSDIRMRKKSKQAYEHKNRVLLAVSERTQC